MISTAREVWQQMVEKLETGISIVDFDVWISRLEPVTVVGAKLVLLARPRPTRTL